MSQESNTGSSSSGKKKLVLRKKGEDSAPPQPSEAMGEAAAAPGEEAAAKPRMNFKRSAPEASESADEPAAPDEETAPKKSLGLKRSGNQAGAAEPAPSTPSESTSPPAATPPPPAPGEDEPPKKLGLKRSGGSAAPTSSPEDATPKGDMHWGLSEEEQQAIAPGESATSSVDIPSAGGPASMPPPPVAGPQGATTPPGPPPPPASVTPPPPPPPPGAVPPPPPPGAGVSPGGPPPPPTTGSGHPGPPPLGKTAPPQAAPESQDLVGQELSAEKKPSPLKGILVGLVVLVIVGGGVAAIAVGVMGAMGENSSDAPANADDVSASDLASLPKDAIDQAQSVVDQVNQKASTDEILGDAAPSPKAESAPEPAPAPPEPIVQSSPPEPSAGPVVEDQGGQADPQIEDWVESIRPESFGRGKMIFQGQSYREGDVVNAELDVRWVGEDTELDLLLFRDANGVVYEKDY